MIILKTLKWNNCFSYGADNVINLNENTITQIVGTNGAGKSSIPLIIEEVLFNKNSKGLKKADIPNRNLGENYDIELEFDVDDAEYVLTVSRKSTIKVKLVKDGTDISSHTATNTFKTVLDLLGMDFKTMSQLFYQSTKESLQFLTATDTNRKKFLIDLLHLEKYVELFEIFKEAVKELSTSVTALDSQLSTVQNWLDTNKLEATDILPMLEMDIDTSEDEIQIGKLTEQIANISDKNRKISMNEDNKKLLSKIDINEVSKISANGLKAYDEQQAMLGASKSQLDRYKKSVAKLQELGDTCPTCEQSIQSHFKQSLINNDLKDIEKLEKSITVLNAEIAEIQKNNEEYKRKVSIQRQWEELFRSIDKTLPSELLDKADLESKLSDLKTKLNIARVSMNGIIEENQKRTKLNTRRQVIQEQTEKYILQLDEVSAKLLEASNKLARLEILKKAFSTNGLIAYKIENLVKELEQHTNNYLADLSDGRFTLEFVVTNDKLNVEITDDDKTVDILALSSGELARVNTATLLALRKLMSVISKSELNVLFLDEVINVLDEQGKEKLIEVLLEENLNTFIVSHNWTHPLLAKLEIVKDENGVSYIERYNG